MAPCRLSFLTELCLPLGLLVVISLTHSSHSAAFIVSGIDLAAESTTVNKMDMAPALREFVVRCGGQKVNYCQWYFEFKLWNSVKKEDRILWVCSKASPGKWQWRWEVGRETTSGMYWFPSSISRDTSTPFRISILPVHWEVQPWVWPLSSVIHHLSKPTLHASSLIFSYYPFIGTIQRGEVTCTKK